MKLALTPLVVALLCLPAVTGAADFKDKPAAARTDAGVQITFSVTEPTDVEVAILGAGDKIVRHLAAGVLGGVKPPPPPLAAGLSQKLTWDGKGDWNLPVGEGPFKVRVRLGMGVKFGRTIADSPYNFNETFCRGLAVDPGNGDLYMLSSKTRDSALIFLRVFDRTGKYLREIMPYPANLDEASRKAFGSVAVPDSADKAPMNYHSLWPTFYPFAEAPEGTRELGVKLMAVHPTQDCVVLLAESFHATYRIRKSDGRALSETFAERLWDKKLAGSAAVGPVAGAISPDGKTMYFAGYAASVRKDRQPNRDWPDGRVFRAPFGGKGETFVDVPLPEDAPPPRPGWNWPAHVQSLHGVTVDKAGRVYVCDAAGGKVHVFDPSGKPIGAAEVKHAYNAVVNDKTGAIYVVTRPNTEGGKGPRSLVKLSGFEAQAKIIDTMNFPAEGAAADPMLAGDFTGDAPQLWLAGCPNNGSILRIADTGEKLKVVEDLAARDKLSAGFACRLDVDPETDLVYVHNGWACILRYNGVTGEYAGAVDKAGRAKPLIGSEFCIRRDGMIYLSGYENAGGGYSGPWHRLNRDLSEAPLADGRKQFADRYGKMGGGYFGNQGSCVTPDGRLYFNGMFIFRINAVFEVNPDGTPGRGPRLRDAFANSKATTKKEEKISETISKQGLDGALVGWLQDQSGGVEIDPQGNLYVGVRILPRDFKLPEAITASVGTGRNTRHWYESLGSIIKVRPGGGGMAPDSLKPGEKYTIDKAWRYEFNVPEKLEPGVKLGIGQRLDWYAAPRTIHFEGGLNAYPMAAPFSNQCACQTPRFDVDDYGRLYIPNALTCTVQVVDNEGNQITRFGGYGNFDAAGEGATIPLAYPVSAKRSFNYIYVADSANRRVVRVDPTHQKEHLADIK